MLIGLSKVNLGLVCAGLVGEEGVARALRILAQTTVPKDTFQATCIRLSM